SGGTLEIHIEPLLPTEQLVVLGKTPVARALAALGSALCRYVVVAEPKVTAVYFPTAHRITTDLSDVNVDVHPSLLTAMRGDYECTTYYFCGEGCRRRFLKDPAAALAATR